MDYENWKQLWRIGDGSERLGQAFCNQFMGKVYPAQIFYEEDYWVADALITSWLVDNCYYPNTPEIRGR